MAAAGRSASWSARPALEETALRRHLVSVSDPQHAAGIVCGLAAALIWGGGAVVSRHLVTASLDPADLTLLRYVGCFPVALILLLVRRDRICPVVGWPRLIVLLLLAGPLYHALVVSGYRYATAGAGSLLMCGLLPAFALAIASISRGSAPSCSAAAGIFATLAGLALFSAGTSASFAGILIFAASALAWAVLNECVRRWRVDALQLTISLSLLSPLFIPIYLIVRSSPSLAAPAGELMLQLAYHGWLVALGATALFFASVRLAGAAVAAVIQSLTPVFTAGLGATFLGEPLGLLQGLGLIVTLAGVLVSIRALRETHAGEPEGLGAVLAWIRMALSSFDLRLRPNRWS